MKKCNYCGRTEICKGSYPEGCFLENEILAEEFSFKFRYRKMLKAMNWKNKDVAKITGNTLNSIEVVTTKADEDFPRWAKLSVVLYEKMLLKGRITYDEPEPYQSEGGKE